jgi:hypothetical protein
VTTGTVVVGDFTPRSGVNCLGESADGVRSRRSRWRRWRRNAR